MNNLSLREKAVAAVVGMVLLYAVAVGTWFLHAGAAWKKSAKAYRTASETYRRECKLIKEKSRWEEAYEVEKSQMPTFAFGKATDTTWLQKVDELAAKHYVQISSRKRGEEIEAGDVLELPIDVSWEAALESLVKFMHELENTSDGMFDIKVLNFKPSSRKGYLRGSLTLTCAYMREKE